MKKNDLFGIKKGPNDWLYCQVAGVNDAMVEAYVINGAWTLFLDMRTGDASFWTPSGIATAQGLRIAYKGPFPKGIKGDYNAAIDFMIEWDRRGKLAHRWFSFKFAVAETIERFRKACEAFGDVWHPKRAAVKATAEYDDSIPF